MRIFSHQLQICKSPVAIVPSGIMHLNQVEALRRGRAACQSPITGLEHPLNIVRAESAKACFNERSRDISHHVLKKRIGFKPYFDEVFSFTYIGPFQRPHRCFGPAPGTAKC